MAYVFYGKSGCLHIGKDASFSTKGMYITKPVDAANYPGASGKVYAGVNCRGGGGNLRIFENGIEEYRYNTGNRDYAWVAWEWSNGYYCADMEFAFYNGNTKRWSRKTSVGDIPIPALGNYLEIQNLTATPSPCTLGRSVTISLTVANTDPYNRTAGIVWALLVDGTATYAYPVSAGLGDRPSFEIKSGESADFSHVIENIPRFYSMRVRLYYLPPDGYHHVETLDVPITYVHPCEGVSCPAKCYGYDQYIENCVDGVCVPVRLHEANSAQCGYVPPDPCEGVVCDPVSVGLDLYSQKCVDGECVTDALIRCNITDDAPAGYACVDGKWVEEPEPRSPPYGAYGDIDGDGVVSYNDLVLCAKYLSGLITLTPEQLLRADVVGAGEITILDLMLINNYIYGHTDTFPVCADPCVGIACENACVGADLYSQKCVNGVCVPDALIEANSEQCGYVPPPPPPDPCEGIACENGCVGLDLYSQKCVNGVCVPDALIEANSEQCGYVTSPFPDPTPPPTPPPSPPGAVMPPGAVGGMISDSGYVYAILLEHWDSQYKWNGHTGLKRFEMYCYPNDTEWTTDKWGRMINPVTVTDRHVYSPIAPGDTHSFTFISKFNGKTYRMNGIIRPGGVEWGWEPELAPPPECTLTDADYFTCPDGTRIQLNECVNGVKVPIIPIPTCPPPAPPPPPQLCTEGETRSPLTCWDGTPIMTEVCVKDEFGGTAWLPSGEMCPMQAITRVMDMAIPAIMYEGQVVDIVVQVFCGAAASTNEPTTLQVDGMAVQTKNTLAGNVTFRWTAKGVGMHKVCAVIPINPGCAVPGTICKTITVSAHVEGIMEQIKAEKSAYESQLEYLRGLKKQLKARPVYGAIPGSVFIPPSFAGRIVDVGGIIRTVPPGGISIPVPPGSNIITIIGDAGERINVPVDVNPGLTVTLPPIPGLPGLPGGF